MQRHPREHVPQPPSTHQLFALYDRRPVHQCVSSRQILGEETDETELSLVFFSPENQRSIMNQLRHRVFVRSNERHTIEDQSFEELAKVMKSLFAQHARHLPEQVSEQVAALNELVLEYAVAQVWGEVQGYRHYRRDLDRLAVPMAHPTVAKSSDRGTLEWTGWF